MAETFLAFLGHLMGQGRMITVLATITLQLTANDGFVLADYFRYLFLFVTRLQQCGNLVPLLPG